MSKTSSEDETSESVSEDAPVALRADGKPVIYRKDGKPSLRNSPGRTINKRKLADQTVKRKAKVAERKIRERAREKEKRMAATKLRNAKKVETKKRHALKAKEVAKERAAAKVAKAKAKKLADQAALVEAKARRVAEKKAASLAFTEDLVAVRAVPPVDVTHLDHPIWMPDFGFAAGVDLNSLNQEQRNAMYNHAMAVSAPFVTLNDIDLELTADQRVALTTSYNSDMSLYSGSAGSGKSYSVFVGAILQALNVPDSVILIHRRSARTARSVRDFLRSLMLKVDVVENKNDLTFTFENNSVIQCIYARGEQELRHQIHGKTRLDLFICDEATTDMSEDMVRYVLSRLRNPKKANLATRIVFICNPIGVHLAFYKRYFSQVGQDYPTPGNWANADDRDLGYIHLDVRRNRFVSDQYIKELQSGSEVNRLRYLEGSWEAAPSGDTVFNVEAVMAAVGPPAEDITDYKEIVVAIDPTTGSGNGDVCGLVVCAIDNGGQVHILDDLSTRGRPATWARAAVKAYEFYEALGPKKLTMVAESNAGRELIKNVINQAANRVIPVKLVQSSVGKAARASVPSTLVENGQVTLSDDTDLGDLIAELCSFTGKRNSTGSASPDRLDAAVIGINHLIGKSKRRATYGRAVGTYRR